MTEVLVCVDIPRPRDGHQLAEPEYSETPPIQPEQSEPSDQQLLQRHIDGDPSAFGEVYRRHQNNLYGFALMHLHDQYLAEDVVAETFTRTLARIADDPSAVRFDRDQGGGTGYFLAVAKNMILDYRKNVGRQRTDYPGAMPEASHHAGGVPALSVEEQASSNEQLRLLLEGVERMTSKEQRIAFVARYIGLYSDEEISKLIDRPKGAIRQLVQRSKASIKGNLSYDPVDGLTHQQ